MEPEWNNKAVFTQPHSNQHWTRSKGNLRALGLMNESGGDIHNGPWRAHEKRARPLLPSVLTHLPFPFPPPLASEVERSRSWTKTGRTGPGPGIKDWSFWTMWNRSFKTGEIWLFFAYFVANLDYYLQTKRFQNLGNSKWTIYSLLLQLLSHNNIGGPILGIGI